MPKEKDDNPYRLDPVKFEADHQEWRVKGPGIVQWDSLYHHDTERKAQDQIFALYNAYKMGRGNARFQILEALGLGPAWGSRSDDPPVHVHKNKLLS